MNPLQVYGNTIIPQDIQWELSDDNIKRIDRGETILHNYCKFINTTSLEIFKYLIEIKGSGSQINLQDRDKKTPVWIALETFDPNSGDIAVLVYLLAQNRVKISGKDRYGRNLLHLVCQNINKFPIDILKLLIEKGADINSQDEFNNTPLQYALIYFNPAFGDITVLTHLLSQTDININIKGQYNRNLLHFACANVNLLPIDIFKSLVEALGCDVIFPDKYNETPIHLAFNCFNPNQGGKTDVLIYLLSQENVIVNTTDRPCHTLLHLACVKINSLPFDVFKYLIETKGFDLNFLDPINNTPIHHAFLSFNHNDNHDTTILQYLLNQKDVNVNIKGEYGNTLLHLACEFINTLPIDVFKFLIEINGADINAQNDNKFTPLHYAIHFSKLSQDGHITTLIYLLSHRDVDFSIQNRYCCTPLHLACSADLIAPHMESQSDNFWLPSVEIITERLLQQVFDETL